MKPILYIFFLISIFSFCQKSAEIKGRIIDIKTGFPIESATIILQNTTQGVLSDSEGYFILSNISPNSYNIEVSFLGYKTQVKYNIILKTVANPILIFEMEEDKNILDEIVVIQSPFKKTKETPISIQTFSAVEIATYPGGNNDITKVAQSFPGISPSIGGFRNDLIIRGGAPNETVYYLDDIEIPNINHFSTQGSAGGPVGMLNVSFVKEVSLATSAFNAKYDNPLSGVLAFNQRNGNNEKANLNIRVGASEAGLTFETPVFKKKGEKRSNTSLIASVRRSYLEFLFEFIGLPIRPDYWDYQFKLNHKIDEYNSINFLGLGAIDDFSVALSENFDEAQQATAEQVPIIEQTSSTFGVSWNRKYKNGKGNMNTTISTNQLTNVFSRYRNNTNKEDLFFQNDSQERETKIRFRNTRFYGNLKISFGSNLQFSQYKNETFIQNASSYNTDLNFWKYGFFLQASNSLLSDKLDISFGVRSDADTFLQNSNLLETIAPRLSFSYKLNEIETWIINGSFGYYYKIPPYTILGFQNNSQSVNSDVKYTRSRHLVLGIEHNITNASRINVEGFYKKYSQFPISVADNVSLANKGADFSVLGNEEIISDGLGRTYGLEFLFQQKLTKNFYGIFAYTIFKSEYSNIQGTYLPSVWDSRHLISFTGGYKLKRNWEISARYRFSGETPYLPIDKVATLANYPEIVLNYEALGTKKLNVFNQADIRIDKRWNFKKLYFSLFMEVQNFLSQAIPRPENYALKRDENGIETMPRELIIIGEEDQSIPIPTIGIVLDF